MIRYPKISIVTPSFNQGSFIEQTITSILDQQYPNLEYIIIDGGSTDNTLSVIRKYEKYLAYWHSNPDKGQTDAINMGFAKSTGDVFNWLNSDDYFEKDTLHTVASLFKDGADVVCGKEWGFWNHNPQDKTLHPGTIIEKNTYRTLHKGIIDQPCTFFRRESVVSLFPLNIRLSFVMDRQLWWRYLLKNGQAGVVQTDKILTYFRLHENSKTIAANSKMEEEAEFLAFSMLYALKAPALLLDQFSCQKENPVPDWSEVNIKKERIFSEFALHFAIRNYVKGDIGECAKLMRLVYGYKGLYLDAKEWRYFFLSDILPRPLWSLMKKTKAVIS